MIEAGTGTAGGRRRAAAVIALAILVLAAAGARDLWPDLARTRVRPAAPAAPAHVFVADLAAADPLHAAVGLVTDGEGGIAMYLTGDGGLSWRHAPLRPGPLAQAVCFSASEWLLLGFGAQADRAWLTSDGGRAWQARPLPPAGAGAGLEGLPVFLDAEHGWQLAGAGAGLGPGPAAPVELWRTTDGAATWTRLPAAGLPPGGVGRPAFSTPAQGVVTVTAPGRAWPRVLFTQDGGSSWVPGELRTPAGSGLELARQGLLQAGGRTVFWAAVTGPGPDPVARLLTSSSTDGGRGWSALAPGPVYAGVAPVADGAGRLLLPAGTAGLAVSADFGASWTSLPGPAGLSLLSIAPAARSPDTLFAIAAPAGAGRGPAAAGPLLLSLDGGASWREVRLPRLG